MRSCLQPSMPNAFCSMNDRASFCASGNGSVASVVSSIFALPESVNTLGFQLYLDFKQYSMCLRLLGLNLTSRCLMNGSPAMYPSRLLLRLGMNSSSTNHGGNKSFNSSSIDAFPMPVVRRVHQISVHQMSTQRYRYGGKDQQLMLEPDGPLRPLLRC